MVGTSNEWVPEMAIDQISTIDGVPTLDTDPVIILKSFDGDDVWCWHIHERR
jgi:hypothetical protein